MNVILPCRVWLNPSQQEFVNAIRQSSTDGLRGLITEFDLYVWQSMNLLHTDFERITGISGVRVGLRNDMILVNDETISFPEHFPWIFQASAFFVSVDLEERRTIVTNWLLANERLSHIYLTNFKVSWYS